MNTRIRIPIASTALVFFLTPFLHAQPPDTTNQNRPIEPLLRRLERFVEKSMEKTGVPGVAVAVVYQDKVVYLKGFGVRKAGSPQPVDPDTRFQLASVSKPISSTVIASLVGTHDVNWDDKIIDLDPGFRLSDPNVTEQLTIRDLLSHRSGLDTSAGDVLEDLGFSRPVILHQMRLLRVPLVFRKDYRYSNFPYTEAGIAAAKAVRTEWEELAQERLFGPLGMRSSSYRYTDFENARNKAALHVFDNGKAVARYQRDADAEAPAGGASASVRDLAQWLRLQLGGGAWNGQQIVETGALSETHTPQIQTGTSPLAGEPEYYGLGWNIGQDAAKRPVFGHSGAFSLGAGTAVRFSPADHLGIVVLTNTIPTGLAEAACFTLLDWYDHGAPTQDWLALFSNLYKTLFESLDNASTDYSKLPPPSSPAPGKPLSAYAGIYSNRYYGDIEISNVGESLWMRLPPTGALYTLTHWDGDTFTYRFKGDPGISSRGVKFTFTGVPKVEIENLSVEGNGVFTRRNVR